MTVLGAFVLALALTLANVPSFALGAASSLASSDAPSQESATPAPGASTPPAAPAASAASMTPASSDAVPPATAATATAKAHWAIRTSDPQAQALFDHGLAMMWAFDVAQARLDFAAAAERDPDCAMAYWGMAETDTIDINAPTTPEGEIRGGAAIGNARRHLAHASEQERALIDALALRYNKGPIETKYARYTAAMSAYVHRYPTDANAMVVAGYARITSSSSFLDANNAITPPGHEAIADADRALALDPGNIGAHHLRIHVLEFVNRAADAASDARALESLTYEPGESHLPHMAGHIWARLGDYAALVRDNETAVENDRAWNAMGDGPGQVYMSYYHDHDVAFVLYGLSTVGRNDEAQAFVSREDTDSQIRLALRLHQDLRVAQLDPTDKKHYSAIAHAIAAGRRGDIAVAKAEAAKANVSAPEVIAVFAATRAIGEHDVAARIAAYAKAYDATKNDYPGDPKTYWQTPIGEGYGAALLAGDKPALAETVFAAELKRFPNDPHLEWGLARAQAMQGKDDAAARAAYRAHWKGSRDLTLDDLG